MMPLTDSTEEYGLKSYEWLLTYKTSSTIIDGRPLDILQDFYLPALNRASHYDRVAGYFRSSSLAAASQGFSSFIGRQGKMRLIVGADLAPADVLAILDGNQQKLAAKLNAELENSETWPRAVKDGVTLLAWLVAHRHLEVKVAFRLHLETGQPLPLDAVDDGYVHEKWFIMRDDAGNRLYGSGTLNESKTALVLNAENIDVHCDWWGKTDRQRVDEAEAAFQNLWEGNVAHMPVMSIPEAVRRKLIKFAAGVEQPQEIDGTAARLREKPNALELLRFALLRDAPKMPGGKYVGLETAPVEPWPHQAVVARTLVENWPYSYLLCDEVGLGKTIEAGLAFRSLYLSGVVKRILIAAPASLIHQWHRQMASKMLLPFGLLSTGPAVSHKYLLPQPSNVVSAGLYAPDLVIMSTGLLARQERAQGLGGVADFDIALVDEAHYARRANPTKGFAAPPEFGQLYNSIKDYLRPNARSLWLATATPMQLHPVEVYDLLALSNRVGSFQFDPTLSQQYYEILGQLVREQNAGQEEWDFLRRVINAIRMQDPLLWQRLDDYYTDRRIRVRLQQWLENGRIPKGRDVTLMLRFIFGASPLSRVMMRHNRRLLEIYQEAGKLQQNLAKRNIYPLQAITFNDKEKQIYNRLEEYCVGLAEQIRKHGDQQSKQMVSFLLSFLRLRFASSFFAFRETLKRRLQKVEATLQYQDQGAVQQDYSLSDWQETVYSGEDEGDSIAPESLLKNRSSADLKWEKRRLLAMLADMSDLSGLSSKMKFLFTVLDGRKIAASGRIKQTVIFTRFYDTLVDLLKEMRRANPQIRIGTYSGQGAQYYDADLGEMVDVNREEVKEIFLRGEIDVLVCTDAAAEGLNLQTADLLVNYDLGWNPMKIEQRIGRIDRIGQRHNQIYVLNLCYAGSAEQTVYGRLWERLLQANMIVGTQQISLLPVEPEHFQALAEGKMTPEELEKLAKERIAKQRSYSETMEIKPDDLYQIYKRMEQNRPPLPVNMASIWSALSKSEYLKEKGCKVSEENKTIELVGITGVPDGSLLTVSRQVYEEGIADSGRRIHFASYGDPCFDALMQHFNAFELPDCVRRIEVPVENMDGVQVVAYAAICREENGAYSTRLLKSWSDVEGLVLAGGQTIPAASITAIKEQLQYAARQEYQSHLVGKSVERTNYRAALAQEILNFLVIHNLIEFRAGKNENALFWATLGEVETLFSERPRISVVDLPADLLRQIKNDILFDFDLPHLGAKANISTPRILGQSAMNAAARLAARTKVRKSELKAKRILNLLQREIDDRRRQLKQV